MRNTDEQLIQRIASIENQLRSLRLELEDRPQRQDTAEQDNKGPLQIGDKVRIKNPKRSQPSEGILTKLHPRTRRGTVTAVTKKGNNVLIVRLLNNLERIQ